MFAKRYSPDELIDIIAAPSYSPEIINYVKKVSNEPFLSQFLSHKPKLGITGTIAKDYVEADTKDAVPYVSTKQVKGLHAYIDDAKYISKEADIEWAKCRVEDGDIIINKSGNVGAAAVLCCAPYAYVNSVSDIINIKLAKNAAIDRDYLVVYLNSPYGQKQLQRLSGGAIFSHVSLHAIPDIRVFHPDIKAQKYIGDKVRQAEQLRAWAKVLYRVPAFIDALVQGVLPQPLINLLVVDKKEATKELTKFLSLNIADADTKKVFQSFIAKNKMGSVDTEREFFHINTVATDAIEDFLSAQTYRPAITEAFDIITSRKYTCLQAMSLEPIRQGATPKFSSIGKKCIKSKQTRDLFLEETGYETVDPGDEQNKRIVRLKRNDVLVTRQGAGTVGRASIFLDDEETYITDSLFLVRIDSNKAHPAFIAGFLRSYTGQRLIEKGVYGSTGQLNLSSGALRNIPVPDVDLDFQNFLGEALCTADTLFKLSTRLTQAAKTLVEALIEGQLTEQQLIQAQQALGDGDNSLDQAILSKLNNEGYAVEGAEPLFSDIDELYRLLESAAQAEAEE